MQPETSCLVVPHGRLSLPVFLPDATHGVVRSVDATDLRRCGVQALQTNVFHLMQRPGSTTVRALGGVHRMLGWDGAVVTDSGGFQAYSLLREGSRFGTVTDRGLLLRPEGSGRKLLTPEKCIQLQIGFGTDIAICLDDCTHPDDPLPRQELSVRRTVAWAKRSKAEFERILEKKRVCSPRPLLFAVVQGGSSLPLRRQCGELLLEIGFDGYGFGGWPFDAQGALLSEALAEVRATIGPGVPLHALGIGHPVHIVSCVRLGYGLLDSVLPTRDARQGRLYAWRSPGDPSLDGEWFAYRYLQDTSLTKDAGPISQGCTCHSCTTYSIGYLHHLHAIGDALCQRLATIHNLHFVCELMTRLRLEWGGTGTLQQGKAP